MAKQVYQLNAAEAPASGWMVPIQPADGSLPLRRVPIAALPIPAATTEAAGLMSPAEAAKMARILVGEGTPQGVVTASPSTLYFRTDGSGDTAIYLKVSGSGDTGWQTLQAATAASATAAAEAASLAADDAADKLAEVEGLAATASTAASNAADALSEIEGLAPSVTAYDTWAAREDDPLTVDDVNLATLVNKHQIWTIDGGDNVAITLVKDAFLDAEHPERVVGIPIMRRGDGAGALTVQFEEGGGLPAVIEPCGDPVVYVARDGDDTANTSGPLFTAALPDVTVTAAAGEDRIVVSFSGISVKTAVEDRDTTFKVGGVAIVAAGQVLPFNQESATGVGIMAGGVAAIGTSASESSHVVAWETNQAARESQFVIARAYKRIDQAAPVAYSNRDSGPFTGGPSDGTYYTHGVTLDPGDDEGLYAVSAVLSASSASLANYSLGGGTATVALQNTGGTSARDLALAMLESASVETPAMHRLRRLIAQGNFQGNGVGFLLKPASSAGGALGTVLVDGDAPAELTRRNQRGVILLYADGVTAELVGAG